VVDGGKVDVIENLFLPDCAIHRPEGNLKGTAALRSMVAGRRANFSHYTTEVHDIFESGDRVVVRLIHRGTGAGTTYRFRIGTHDIKDESLTWDAIVIFRMQNGTIAEEWVSRDELGMLLSAGILKADGGSH
jgi:predicted ester cyclase